MSFCYCLQIDGGEDSETDGAQSGADGATSASDSDASDSDRHGSDSDDDKGDNSDGDGSGKGADAKGKAAMGGKEGAQAPKKKKKKKKKKNKLPTSHSYQRLFPHRLLSHPHKSLYTGNASCFASWSTCDAHLCLQIHSFSTTCFL